MKEEKRCLCCCSTNDLKKDEFSAWICIDCRKNIDDKVKDFLSEDVI